MTDGGGEAPPESAPQGPQAPAARERLRVAAQRVRLQAKIKLLHTRYVLGYLAAGFGVSAPVTLGYQIYYGQDSGEVLALTGLSLLYGVAFSIPFLLLEPVTRVEWQRMRVPEFRIFELVVSRSAALVSLGLFAAGLAAHALGEARLKAWLPPGLFWTVFVLMGTAWAKIKAQTWIFPEFYADHGGERVLEVPVRDPRAAKPPDGGR